MSTEEPGVPTPTPPEPPTPPAAPTSPSVWWLARGQTVFGPYLPEQLRRLADLGHLEPRDQLRRHVGDEWTPWIARAAELGLTTTPSASTVPEAPPVAPMAVPVSPAVPTPEDRLLGYVVPIHVSPLALVAGYAGLISPGCVPLGPVAIVCGILGLRRLKSGQPGAFRCWTGIVLGFIGSVLLVIALVALLSKRPFGP
jgi:hypothetical protein